MSLLAVDIETVDPGLKLYGQGSRGGRILCVGLYDGEEAVSVNPDSPMLKQLLADPTVDMIFHNGTYDLDWLQNIYGLEIKGICHDTMSMAVLLNAYAGQKYAAYDTGEKGYSLDACSHRAGLVGKNKNETIEAWAAQNELKNVMSNLDQVPRDVLDKYVKQDVVATWDLYHAQEPRLRDQGLWPAYEIECKLYPALMDMKKRGIRVDAAQIQKLHEEMTAEYIMGLTMLQMQYPELYSLKSSKDLQYLWEQRGIPITQKTDKGAPSFNKAALEAYEEQVDDPVIQEVARLRNIQVQLSKFIDMLPDYIRTGNRVHSTFYPLERDTFGTVTGRWSSANPGLQQTAADEDKGANIIRSLYLPDEDCILGAFDYKQIEYIVFIHFAEGEGAEEARAQVAAGVDYHDLGARLMGWDPRDHDQRKLVKNMGFGSLYGLGYRSFAERFRNNLKAGAAAKHMSIENYARTMLQEYFRKVPFVKPTNDLIQQITKEDGYVLTVGGRRQRTPPDEKWYKMTNYLVQGSAADILKKGLTDAWDAGVFSVLHLHMTVHDEVVFSIPRSHEAYEACLELERCMTQCYQLRVPMRVDKEAGPDWYHCSAENWLAFEKEYRRT